MSEITSVEVQKKDKTRCNVYVDGRFYCGIKLEVAVKYHLKAGMPIDKKQLDEIQFETEKSQAFDKAANYISVAMKTRRQMHDFLSKKGYTEEVISYVLEKLESIGLIDDEEYCKAYVKSVSGKGKRALEAALIKRGAERGAIDKVLSDCEEDTDDAAAVLSKYLRGKVCDKQTLYKGFKYLLSKGYGYDTAKAALQKFGETDEDY